MVVEPFVEGRPRGADLDLRRGAVLGDRAEAFRRNAGNRAARGGECGVVTVERLRQPGPARDRLHVGVREPLVRVEQQLVGRGKEGRVLDQRLAALERVLEQRSAAAAAIEEADGELAELSGSGMDESALRRAWEAHGGTLVRRKVAFLTATALIIAGAGLQLAGNWPGCCPAIGVLPQG